MIHRMGLLAGAALALAPALAEKPSEIEATMIAQGRTLALEGRFAEALPVAEKVIAEVEKRLGGEKRKVYSGQSAEMLMANMMDAATEGSDAVDVGPAYGEALFWKGYALIELGRVEEAGASLDRAVAVSPANPQFLCEDASWHNRRRHFAKGLALFEKCETNSGYGGEDADQWHGAAMRGRGYALTELGRLDEAEQLYRLRLMEDPGDAKARNELDYIQRQRRTIARATT